MKVNYSLIVKVSAFYNLIVGGIIVLFPNLIFNLAHFPEPNYQILWQCLGMTVAVVGYGIYLASLDLKANKNILILGILGKMLGPVILGGYGVIINQLPLLFAPIILFDLIWSVFYFFTLKNLNNSN